MSAESMEDLNTQTVIGLTDTRGSAWHRRDDLMGDESNHYPGFIPREDVLRRIFHWKPVNAPVAYLVPCAIEDATYITREGRAVRIVESQRDRRGVLRSDNDLDLGVFGDGSHHPPYQQSLMHDVDAMVGTQLGISAAGLLVKGARAWVEMSLPSNMHDPKSGISYRPYLVSGASMDGSLSLTRFRAINATICDNTFNANLGEAKAAGVVFRRKHTSEENLEAGADELEALGILERTHEEFERSLHRLIEIGISEKQRDDMMDILVPLPDEEGRGQTLAQNKRDQLIAIHTTDPMCRDWANTGWGWAQTFSVHGHHYDLRRGEMGRSEGNVWRAMTGKTAKSDSQVVKAILQVAGA